MSKNKNVLEKNYYLVYYKTVIITIIKQLF